jgi:hypothetical protein
VPGSRSKQVIVPGVEEEEEEVVARLVMRVADMDDPVPTAITDTCGRCGEPVWVDAAQFVPYPELVHQLVCIPCAMVDAELGPEVLKVALDVRTAHLLFDPDGDGRD